MPLTVRKFDAQVKDPESGQMIPAGLLSSDSLKAITAAKNSAVTAIQEKGEQTKATIPDDYTELSDSVGDLKESLDSVGNAVKSTGFMPIELTTEGYYQTRDKTVIDPLNIVSNTNFRSAVIDCQPGQVFTIHAIGASTNTVPWIFIDSSNNVLSKSPTIGVDEVIVAPPGASKLLLQNRVATLAYQNAVSYYGDNFEYTEGNTIGKVIGFLGSSSFSKASGESHVASANKIMGLNIASGDKFVIYFKRSGSKAYTYFYGYDINGINQINASLAGTNVLEDSIVITAPFDIASIAWADSNTGYAADYSFAAFDYNALLFNGNSVENQDIIKSIRNAKYNVTHNNQNPTPALTLLHFSDCHGDKNAVRRIKNTYEEINDLVDDIIFTGDMMQAESPKTEDEMPSSWWDPSIMVCIGNHDTAVYNDGVANWTALSMANRDAYYIAPFESGWDITHTSGKSYYYKDYTDQHVRLIVMDVMLYYPEANPSAEASVQTAWLEDLLKSAATNGLHVLIAIHSPHTGSVAKECSFSRYNQASREGTLGTPQIVIDTVHNVIADGNYDLHFIGYICGHTHQDTIWDVENNGEQLMYCVTCASTHSGQTSYSDMYRVGIDAYNLVTIDTVNMRVKIVRGGGANIDECMRTRKAICIDYSTGTVIGEVL